VIDGAVLTADGIVLSYSPSNSTGALRAQLLNGASAPITNQPVTFSLDANGDGTNETYNGTTGTNGVVTVAISSSQPEGHTIPYSAFWDGVVITASANATATIPDTIPPLIACPSDILVGTDPGLCSANVSNVNLGAPVASDGSGSVALSNNAPIQFATGVTLVIWTATDPSSNSASCTQQVTVVDSEPPSITCRSNVTVDAEAGLCYASIEAVDLDSPSVGDNCGIANLANDAPEQFPVGTSMVTWTVTDMSSNAASCVQLVTVVHPNPDGDDDGDGLLNLQECLSGSDPNNPMSGLRIISLVATNDDIRLTWQTIGGTTNIVQMATAGPSVASFADVSAPLVIPGAGDVMFTWTQGGGATNAPAVFYRVKLVP
jgi:hypothetical protein